MGADAFGSAPFSVTPAGTLKALCGQIGCFTLASGILSATMASETTSGIVQTCGIYVSRLAPFSIQICSNVSCSSMTPIQLLMTGTNGLATDLGQGTAFFGQYSGVLACSSVAISVTCDGSTNVSAPVCVAMCGGTTCYAMYTNGKIHATGGTVCTSDRNMKTDFQDVNVLELLRRMPVTKWRFKDSCDYRIGPMAQDFNNLFQLNRDWQTNLTVSGLDGIALKAIKEVDENVQEHDKCISILKQKLQKLECEMAAIREMIN